VKLLTTLPVASSFRLLPTVLSHGWFQCPPFRWDREESRLHRVIRTADGSPRAIAVGEQDRGTLLLFHEGSEATREEREDIVEKVSWMLQLDRDIDGFHHLCRSLDSHQILAEIGAGRLLRGEDLWEDLVKAICGTNIAWPQAVRCTERIVELGERSVGGHAWPTSAQVLEAGEGWLREKARVGYRSKYIIDLARSIESGSFDPGPCEGGNLKGEDLQRFFNAVGGIGPATSAYLMALHGDASRLSIDSAVIAFCSRVHFGGRKPRPAEVERLYHRFGRWRALVYWFEFLLEEWWPQIRVVPDEKCGLRSTGGEV